MLKIIFFLCQRSSQPEGLLALMRYGLSGLRPLSKSPHHASQEVWTASQVPARCGRPQMKATDRRLGGPSPHHVMISAAPSTPGLAIASPPGRSAWLTFLLVIPHYWCTFRYVDHPLPRHDTEVRVAVRLACVKYFRQRSI